MDLVAFRKTPVMGIIRGIKLDQLEPVIAAAVSGGLKTIEITMNSEDAPRLIREAKRISQNNLMLGAGTVLDLPSLQQALDAGASFIVTPTLVKDVFSFCLKHKIPVFPGALTPQEIYNCWKEGATMVKVFPAKLFGPEYIKEIKGPFNDIELLACSGVTPENMREYFSCGASAVAFGASVFKKEWLDNQDYPSISRAIKAYIEEL